MTSYYNEKNPYAAQWLRNLIEAGAIAPGDVDERSIVDVRAGDLAGYDQCHFFAGIGGWPLALRIARWPDERDCWTGSCPCQPYSAAGQRNGASDERHLWPVWFALIKERGPAAVFGEQVAEAIRFGWLDAAFDDMEAAGYACAAAVLPACSVGAPHRRDRIWFVAHGERAGLPGGVLKCAEPPAIQLGAHRRGRFGYPVGPAWDGEPDLAVLVHGLPADVAATETFGNAIVPRLAAEFIAASAECQP